MNAKEELIKHIKGRGDVLYVRCQRVLEHGHSEEVIEGRLEEVLPKLDFEFDDGYGSQELCGTIWFTDGTWSDRDEIHGSVWWMHRVRPELPTKAMEWV